MANWNCAGTTVTRPSGQERKRQCAHYGLCFLGGRASHYSFCSQQIQVLLGLNEGEFMSHLLSSIRDVFLVRGVNKITILQENASSGHQKEERKDTQQL